MTETRLELFADYHQVYLMDEGAEGPDPAGWDDALMARRVDAQPGMLVIFTRRNMTVPLTVAVLAADPGTVPDGWDHVVDCAVAVPSGRLVAMGCTDYAPDAARIDVPAGMLRARVLMGRLAEISEDGLEGADHYRVELWPGPARPLAVARQWEEPQ